MQVRYGICEYHANARESSTRHTFHWLDNIHMVISGAVDAYALDTNLHKQITAIINYVKSSASSMTYISLKSFDIASTSISPVIFSWFEKCRRRVISRKARFARDTLSKTLVTSLIATVSPEISSAADLRSVNQHCQDYCTTADIHDDTIRPRAHVPNHLPSSLYMKYLSERRNQRVVAPVRAWAC